MLDAGAPAARVPLVISRGGPGLPEVGARSCSKKTSMKYVLTAHAWPPAAGLGVLRTAPQAVG